MKKVLIKGFWMMEMLMKAAIKPFSSENFVIFDSIGEFFEVWSLFLRKVIKLYFVIKNEVFFNWAINHSIQWIRLKSIISRKGGNKCSFEPMFNQTNKYF
jgi:hypothetical protein